MTEPRETERRRRPALGSVLVALDFSASARMALDRAIHLPLQPGANLELFHVVSSEGDAATAARDEAEAARGLEHARTDVASALAPSAPPVFVSVGHGAPAAAIADRAHHGTAELVVVGRHGQRRLRDAMIGSTAEQVIRNGSVSVLVVATAPAAPYRRPLVAVDMSDSARLALELAARICAPDVEAIDVLHVIDSTPPAVVRMHEMQPDLAPPGDQTQRARDELSRFLAEVNAGVRWNVSVQAGDPRSTILAEAQRRGADLVALGTKGRTGLARVLVGSVAEGVIRGAACDVLVARLPVV